jgi:hypothetical protein
LGQKFCRGLLLFLLLGFVHTQPLLAQDSLKLVSKLKLGWLPALESFALPGSGQFAAGDRWRGGVHLLGAATLAGSACYYWQSQYQRADWDQSGKNFDRGVARGLAGWYGLYSLFSALDSYYTTTHARVTTPSYAALLSIAFPGLGQAANGKHWKAMVIFAAESGLIYSSYYQHQSYLFFKSQGRSIEASFYKDDRNRLIWWSLGAVIYSAADAFVDCHLRTFDVSPNLALTPVAFPENRGVGLGLTIPFSLK